jgi:hypothetical protein
MKRVAVKTNPARMGFRELFRVAGKPGVGLLACGLKLFRILGPDTGGFGFRSFGDRLELRDIDDISRRVEDATEGYREKLEKLGFVPGFAYSIEPYGSQEGHGQVLRHKSGKGGASVVYARCVRNGTETETAIFSFCTPLRDDTYVMTSGNKRLMNKPDNFLCEYMPGKSPKDVWERHLDRVDQTGVTPRAVKTDDDLARIVLYCENEETEFNLERGVFVRMTRDEIEEGERLREEYEEGGAGGRRKKKKKKDDDDEEEEDEEEEDEDEDEPEDEDEDEPEDDEDEEEEEDEDDED